MMTWSQKSGWYAAVLAHGLKSRPDKPFDEPLKVSIAFHFPRPKRFTQKTAWFYRTKLDLDNLVKAVQDALTAAKWWTDDSRICELTLLKQYAPGYAAPGAFIRVETLRGLEPPGSALPPRSASPSV